VKPSISDAISRAAALLSAMRKTRSGGRNGGRPRDLTVDRCACGKMTAKRAKARKHKCEVTL